MLRGGGCSYTRSRGGFKCKLIEISRSENRHPRAAGIDAAREANISIGDEVNIGFVGIRVGVIVPGCSHVKAGGLPAGRAGTGRPDGKFCISLNPLRSEEHTSELQSH